MADGTINITIKISDEKTNVSDPKKQTGEPDSPEIKSNTVEAAKHFHKEIISNALSMLTNIADYDWSRDLSLTDNYQGQRDAMIAKTIIGRATSYVSGIISGAIGGATVGGPWGALAGAALTATFETVNTIIDAFHAQDQENISLRAMDTGLDFTRQRAGWSTHAGSIGEDL